MNGAFTPAVQLVAASVIVPNRAAAVQAIRLSGADWSTVPMEAERHGLPAAVAETLRLRRDTPPSVAAAVETALRANAVNALRGISELLRAVQALESAGVRTVALKGPAFSRWLYGTATYRKFSDLDLLIPRNDLGRAYAALSRIGYRLPDGMLPAIARTIYGGLGAWPLAADGRYSIDLHWRLAHVTFPAALTSEQVMGDSCALELGGAGVRVPGATHAAILTLLHAAKHLWCTLEIVAAIAALMRRDDVDWEQVRHVARKAHAWNGCAAGLRLATELLGADVPAALRHTPWPSASERLCAEAAASLALPCGVFRDRWIERRVHHAALDRGADRVRYDVWRAVAPTPLEWRWCAVPARLRWLYGPMRLVRLATEAARGRLARQLTADG